MSYGPEETITFPTKEQPDALYLKLTPSILKLDLSYCITVHLSLAWNFFEDILPPEITVQIFSFFSLEDLVYVSLVCKPWSVYFDTKDIWKRIYVYNYGEVSGDNINQLQSLKWKRIVRRPLKIVKVNCFK